MSGLSPNGTNYRLRDGDRVKLIVAARVDRYWHDPVFAPGGCWDSHYMLPGSVGIVIRARTPSVMAVPGKNTYFANVDIPHNGMVSRVRVHHHDLQRERKRKPSLS